MKSNWKIFFSALLIFSILILFFSCEKDPVKPEEDTGAGIPEKLDDGWEISTPTIQGMDIEKIRALSTKIHNDDYGKVDGFLIVRNDKLIWEEYFNNYRIDRKHACYSVTKSVNSALIGIAIENGFLDNIDQTIKDFFPEYADIFNQSERKKKLNLYHLLTMTDGLEWDELRYPYSDSRNSYNQWTGQDDRIKYVFERPARSEPGTRFAYNSGISVILGEILHRATEENAITFGQEKLFAPLGITDFYWSTIYSNNEYLVNTGGGLRLRPRDMAKFGLLYLNNGNYKGKQVVSEEWVSESLKPHTEVGDPTYYGYQWWEIRYDRYPQPNVHETRYIHSAIGYGGQFILIVPVNKLIVVLTGNNADDGIDFWDIMFNHILPAVKN